MAFVESENYDDMEGQCWTWMCSRSSQQPCCEIGWICIITYIWLFTLSEITLILTNHTLFWHVKLKFFDSIVVFPFWFFLSIIHKSSYYSHLLLNILILLKTHFTSFYIPTWSFPPLPLQNVPHPWIFLFTISPSWYI